MAHSTCSMATSWAVLKGVVLGEICAAASWRLLVLLPGSTELMRHLTWSVLPYSCLLLGRPGKRSPLFLATLLVQVIRGKTVVMVRSEVEIDCKLC